MKHTLAVLLLIGSLSAQTTPTADTERRLSVTSIRSSVKYCHDHPEGVAWIYDDMARGKFHGWRSEDCSTFAAEVKDIFPEVVPATKQPKRGRTK